MRCEKVIAQLSADLDGELTAAERETVRSHVAGCVRCRAELEALNRTVYAVADLPRLAAPADLRDRLTAQLESLDPIEARPARWRMYWGAAAAIAVAVVIMLLTSPATSRRSAPQAVAPAAKKAPEREIALADKGAFSEAKASGKRSLGEASENATPSPKASPSSNVQAPAVAAPAREASVAAYREKEKPAANVGAAGPAPSGAFGMLQLEAAPAEPVARERIVLPSADPRSAYFNAVTVAVKGGWLPGELQNNAVIMETLKANAAAQGPVQTLHLTLRMKRSQVPLLKSALATAGLRAAAPEGGRADQAAEAEEVAKRPERAHVAENQAQVQDNVAAPAKPLSVPEGRNTVANTQQTAAAPADQAELKMTGNVAGAAGVTGQQRMAENEAEPAAALRQSAPHKAEAAEEPESLVQVMLLFPLMESPAPAAPPKNGAAPQ